MKASICRVNIATSRFFERGVRTASASGPEWATAIVTGAGIRSRRRSSGTRERGADDGGGSGSDGES